MPKGSKFNNHKGRNRKFTSPEELEEQRKQEELKAKWRKEHGDISSEESDEDKPSGSGSSDESDSDEDNPGKAKGVSGLIEIENPNRVVKKNKKLNSINTSLGEGEKPELSRREREEIERQRKRAAYQKAHAEGRTEQARADLARLAIIRQQREEAAKRREEEKKGKDEVKK